MVIGGASRRSLKPLLIRPTIEKGRGITVGAKVREVDGYKLWYSGSFKARNGVGIWVERE